MISRCSFFATALNRSISPWK